MSTKLKNTQSKKVVGTPAAGNDPVTAIQQVARTMPAAEPVTVAVRNEMRNVSRRAPAKLIALVLSLAEESGGNVAGVPIDATASRSALQQATQLRVGAAAARAVARNLEEQALVLSSSVAQRALSATTSLEAFARTPDGRSHAAKAAELRAAARGTKRRASAAKTAKGAKPAAGGAAATTPEVTGPEPVATGVAAPNGAHVATANGAPAAATGG
jgi:hypothetical protein